MAATQPIPDGWQRVRLGDVAEVQTGGTPIRSEPEYWSGNISWMASGEINQRRLKSTAEKITQAGLYNSNAKLFPPGTVMVAMNGQGTTSSPSEEPLVVLGIEASCPWNPFPLALTNIPAPSAAMLARRNCRILIPTPFFSSALRRIRSLADGMRPRGAGGGTHRGPTTSFLHRLGRVVSSRGDGRQWWH